MAMRTTKERNVYYLRYELKTKKNCMKITKASKKRSNNI